jgi:alkanesulfonate monooxygenase SsuD/methylene tetrahydromethanopterin reductase-like flavin-dependent oxidoreductase (luciferase family)
MRLSLFISAQADPGESATERLKVISRQALLAESLGFETLFLGHHYLASSQFFQPLPTASYLAAITDRIRIGLGIYLATLHHPLALAEDLTTLDVLSGGRLTAGLGVGYRRVEYEALGVRWAGRYRRLERSLEVMRALWRGESVQYDQEWGRVDQARVNLRPVQPGGPPVWLGAFGPKGIERSARLDASWLGTPEGTVSDVAEKFELLRAALGRYGHDLERPYPLAREVAVAQNRDEAIEAVWPYLAAQYRGYRSWDSAGRLTAKNAMEEQAVVGNPDQVIARCRAFEEQAGITEIMCRVDWMGMDPSIAERSIRLLGEEVIPALAD